MSLHTRSQKLAQAAYSQISSLKDRGELKKEIITTVKKFPALIHTCGLAQAVTFAIAKKDLVYVGCLSAVLKDIGHSDIKDFNSLQQKIKNEPLPGYLQLSRDAINAASWLKRYAEAIGENNQ